MEREKNKDLVLKDLSSRLPHGVICNTPKGDGYLCSINQTIFGTEYGVNIKATKRDYFNDREVCIKPYLRPLSSITEEEKNELNNYIFSEKGLRYFWFDDGIMYSGPDNQCFIGLGNDTIDRMMDWLNAHYFDYRSLIKSGLALETPEGMYNIT